MHKVDNKESIAAKVIRKILCIEIKGHFSNCLDLTHCRVKDKKEQTHLRELKGALLGSISPYAAIHILRSQ
jgi:hypothetical protein